MTMKPLLLMLCFLASVCVGLKVDYRSMVKNTTGLATWEVKHEVEDINPARHAVIIVDMWDEHWCPSVTASVAAMAPAMNTTLGLMRDMGFTIIWAPSGCDSFYKETVVKKRTASLPDVEIPGPHFRKVERFPISTATNGGCDVPGAKQGNVWTRQITTLTIDEHKDFLITDEDGQSQQELYNIFKAKGITNLIYVGVAENMCIMTRKFGTEEMTARGFHPHQLSVVRELVDTIYSPYDAPYVSHPESIRLQTRYYEQFWGRSFSVYDILTPFNKTM